jgi:hypothetical protein
MSKRRVSTNISQKHWDLLIKHAEKYGTQQRALEVALENLENNSRLVPELTPEEKLCLDIYRKKLAVLCEKAIFKNLLSSLKTYEDILSTVDFYGEGGPLKFIIEYYLNKPLKDCSLKEILDVMIINARASNWFDSVHYTDEGTHYKFIMLHSTGINCSEISSLVIRRLFDSHGTKFDISISSKSVFANIFKN